jgi:hypothetical protein
MDVDGLLQSVVRFSNFMTARLIVSGLVFYVLSGFTDIGSNAEGLLPNLDLMNNVVQNYQNIFDILGVSDFALLLIFFLFVTAIHLTYVAFEKVGDYIPPAIVPLPSWTAIEDLTRAAFDILRDARGTRHTEEENQRLFEFRRKLEAIDAANELEYKEKLGGTYNVFRVSKSLMLFMILAWIWATVSGRYTGDPIFILVALSLAAAAALYTTIAIYRGHHDRIQELRGEVTHQLLGFAAVWLPESHQQRMFDASAQISDLRPAHFKVLMPVYGTADAFIADYRKWRAKRRTKTTA